MSLFSDGRSRLADPRPSSRAIAPVILPGKEDIAPVFRVRLSRIEQHARGTKGWATTFDTMAPATSLPSW
jgi:hypothetical protein